MEDLDSNRRMEALKNLDVSDRRELASIIENLEEDFMSAETITQIINSERATKRQKNGIQNLERLTNELGKGVDAYLQRPAPTSPEVQGLSDEARNILRRLHLIITSDDPQADEMLKLANLFISLVSVPVKMGRSIWHPPADVDADDDDDDESVSNDGLNSEELEAMALARREERERKKEGEPWVSMFIDVDHNDEDESESENGGGNAGGDEEEDEEENEEEDEED